MNTQKIIDEINDLPVEQRAKIASDILQGLNAPDPQVEQAWIEEVERRVDEVDSGKVKMIPGKEFERMRREKKK